MARMLLSLTDLRMRIFSPSRRVSVSSTSLVENNCLAKLHCTVRIIVIAQEVNVKFGNVLCYLAWNLETFCVIRYEIWNGFVLYNEKFGIVLCYFKRWF